MPDDRRPGSPATDPTLTPSQVIGEAATRADSEPSAMRTSSPAVLPSRYAPGQQLGAGGMGEVLLARDEQIGREVAIKRMRVEATPTAVTRFLREAKIQGRLEHPSIVPVHELASDAQGRPFFVMKRLTGTTLARVLEMTSMSRQKLLRAFADVCLAIEFAHRRGVIHRDLKPENIMLGDFGEVYVLDWGIAHVDTDRDSLQDASVTAGEEGATEVGAILGTPGYIPPEVIEGEPIDARADVFALGCILFEILAGQTLLPRGRAALQAVLADVESRPSVRAPDRDCPPELDAICVDTTARDRAKRPSARELAERIERYLDGDRDLALRKTLAADHLAAARAALAAGDGEVERATAMREAGRAIALDPHGSDAAQLVGRLVLQPPREVPREVDERVAKLLDESARNKVRLMVPVFFAFLLAAPLIVLMGVRSVPAFVTYCAVSAANVGLMLWAGRTTHAPTVRNVYVAAVVFAAQLVVMSRMFTPFLVAPALGAMSVLMFAFDARVRWQYITIAYVAVVIGPWLLELVGALSSTTKAIAGDLLLHSPAISVTMPAAVIALAVFAVALIGVSGYVGRGLGTSQRDALRSLELQAWHLRQLVRH